MLSMLFLVNCKTVGTVNNYVPSIMYGQDWCHWRYSFEEKKILFLEKIFLFEDDVLELRKGKYPDDNKPLKVILFPLLHWTLILIYKWYIKCFPCCKVLHAVHRWIGWNCEYNYNKFWTKGRWSMHHLCW